MCSTRNTCALNDLCNDLSQCFLAKHIVDIVDFLRNVLVHYDSARSSLYHLHSFGSILLVYRQPDTYLSMKIDCLLIKGYDNLLRAIELHPLPLYSRSGLSNIVESEYHIL